MLLSAISLASLLALHVAKAQICTADQANEKAAETGNNYVIDTFNSLLPFAYAIGQCTAVDFIGSGTYVQYTCASDGNSVTKSIYAEDSTCSNKPTTTSTIKSGQAPGLVGYFDCSGVNSYAEIQVGANSCGSLFTVYAGLGACVVSDQVLDKDNNLVTILTQVYCDSTQAIIQLYTAGPINTMSPSTSTVMSSLAAMSSSMYESSYAESSDVESSMVESSMIGSSMIESSTMSGLSSSAMPVTSQQPPPPPQCISNFFCDQWVFASSACSDKTPSGSLTVNGKKIGLFGNMQQCQIGNPSGKKKGASTLLAVTNLIVALAVALFSLF